MPSTPRPLAPLEVYLSQIDKTPLLSAEEERELARRVQTGDPAARDRLVRANLRLVVSLARRYAGKGLPLEDLVSEGNLGLLRAAEGFDPNAGTRFATYASYWVKQSTRRALDRDGTTVRLPSYMTALVAKWRQAASDLRRELGRAAAEDEVAGRLGLTPRLVRAVRKALRVLASGRQPDGEGTPLDYLACEKAACPVEELGGAEEMRKAVGSLSALTELEATVLRMRFGLDDAEPATLREVAARLGYTREWVRQIERDALAKLRERVVA